MLLGQTLVEALNFAGVGVSAEEAAKLLEDYKVKTLIAVGEGSNRAEISRFAKEQGLIATATRSSFEALNMKHKRRLALQLLLQQSRIKLTDKQRLIILERLVAGNEKLEELKS